jgi:hypothetical protein
MGARKTRFPRRRFILGAGVAFAAVGMNAAGQSEAGGGGSTAGPAAGQQERGGYI